MGHILKNNEVKLEGKGDGHWSDCATHNEPAMPNGPCNCGGYSNLRLLPDEKGRAPGAAESPKPRPGGSTPSASANYFDLLKTLVYLNQLN